MQQLDEQADLTDAELAGRIQQLAKLVRRERGGGGES